jgi:hypothetical protein
MPPTIRAGQVATNEVLADQLVVDMGTEVFGYDPPGAPMMAFFTKRMKSKPARATTVNWMEDEPVPYWDQLNEALDDSETTVSVDNGAYFQAGNLVKIVSTNEVMRVTGVASNDLTVTRGYIGTAAAAADDAYILNLSTAETEGDNSPQALATVKVKRSNYTQIVKTPVHMTATNMAVEHYNGDEWTYQQRKAGAAHARKWEEIALHGRKKEDLVTSAHPIRAAGGIDEIISTNVLDATGVLTESEFRAWLGSVFRYSVRPGRNVKLLMAGLEMINVINSWGLDKLRLNSTASQTYGMEVNTYQAGFGRLEVVYHPLLEAGYSGTGYILDPDGIAYRPLRNRGTRLQQNIQDNDEDGRKDQYITEATFQFALEKAFGKIINVAA